MITLGSNVSRRGGGPRGIKEWKPDCTINGHGLVIGSSGVGKTYRLRMLGNALANTYKARVIVIDVHGDIDIPGEKRIVFSESSEYGLNPLKINPDRHSGGVRRRIEGFISMINRTSQRLGTQQQATLRNLLKDLYARNGFDPNDYRTWDPKENPNAKGRSRHMGVCPNITDLRKFTAYKTKQVMYGFNADSHRAFVELKKHMRTYDRLLMKKSSVPETDFQSKRTALIGKAMETYREALEMKTGDEDENQVNYGDDKVLRSVLHRIEGLDQAGIFKDAPPPLSPSDRIQVYDIKSLQRSEQRMFVEILLEDLWLEQRAGGQRTRPDTFIFVDEASIFLEKAPADHIMNILIRESRKFGLGMIFASQALDHFSDDVLSNVGMKLILGVDERAVSNMARQLRIDAGAIERVQPRMTGLAQTKIVGDSGSTAFEEIFLSKAA